MSPDDAMQARFDQFDDAVRAGMCARCQGTGEIVTDWERYMHAHPGDVGDEAVSDCPDCDGTGECEIALPSPPLPTAFGGGL